MSTGAAVASPPTILQPPINHTSFEGESHTFTVNVTGTNPLQYQWFFAGSALSNQTNASLALSNIQLSQDGLYHVEVTNLEGTATSPAAQLTVRRASDPRFAQPNGGWDYLLAGDTVANAGTAALDGTWNHDNGTDSWGGDGRGTGVGPVGGISTSNGILTLEDGLVSGSSAVDNRRLYLTHDLAQEASISNPSTLLDDGVTLSFRTRLTPPAPIDPLTELGTAPDGYANVASGKGMFGLRQSGGGGAIISFSLNNAIEDRSPTSTFNFGQAGLHMNNLNGDIVWPLVDPHQGGTVNLLPLDSTLYHEFWITIENNGSEPGTHRVMVYTNGQTAPMVFHVTAGSGSDTPAADYLALGLGATTQRGAFDVDYVACKAGVIPPIGFNVPMSFTAQPTTQFVAEGMTATFTAAISGTPPYSLQWYRDGSPIANATNTSYTTSAAVPADHGAEFYVVVQNDLNSITSSPPALLQLAQGPTITQQPVSLNVTNGDTAVFSVVASGESTLTYQWRLNANNLTGQTSATLVLPGVSPIDAGNYDVVVSSVGGSVTSRSAALTVDVFDFGDAPDPSFPTVLNQNGARHRIVAGMRLGSSVDYELNGQPTLGANGDDLAGTDDEDGVSFLNSLVAGQSTSMTILASTAGRLDAWIDFGRDGSWAQPGDQILTNINVTTGLNPASFNIPPSAARGDTFARFRFSSAGNLGVTGPAADGEVEDYAVTLLSSSDLAISLTPSANPIAVGSNLVFALQVSNLGPSTASGISLTFAVDTAFDLQSIVASQGACAVNNGTITCDLGSLGNGQQASVTVVSIPLSSGIFHNTAQVTAAEPDPVANNNSATTVMTVRQPPLITVHPESQSAIRNETVIFSVTATGDAPLSYAWLLNGSSLAGATNSTLSLANVTAANEGDYTVRVSNNVGTITSQTATLVVFTPPTILSQPQSRTNLAGSDATFSVAVTGSEPLGYQWYFNATTLLSNATNASLTLNGVLTDHAGLYDVEISNVAGTMRSAAAKLTVWEVDFGDAPDPTYPTLLSSEGARHLMGTGLRLGNTIDFEPDGQPELNALGDDLTGDYDEDGVTFLNPWLIGQTVNLEVAASAAGFLNVWIDWNGDGDWSDAGELAFQDKPMAAGINPLNLNVPNDAATGQLMTRFRFNSTGGLSFDGMAQDGEVEDYSILLAAAVDLQVTDEAEPSPVAVGTPLTYSIHVTNQGPSTATGVLVTNIFPATSELFEASTTQGLCANDAGKIVCDLGDLNPSQGATVTLVVNPTLKGILSNYVCAASAEFDVQPANNELSILTTALIAPSIFNQPQSLTRTNGSTAFFLVQATGDFLRYQWQFEGTDIPRSTNILLIIPSISTSNQGTYSVRVFNPVGEVLSNPATLTVLAPVSITGQPQSTTVSQGQTASFTVNAQGTEPITYQWMRNGVNLVGKTSPTLTLSGVDPDDAGTYSVRVANVVNTVVSSGASLTVIVPPSITTQPAHQTALAGSTATLQVGAAGTQPLRYQWFKEGVNLIPGATNAMLTLPNVQTNQSGFYSVEISNVAGNLQSDFAILTVVQADFGDAPDPSFPTLLLFNGARHRIVPGMRLGSSIDFEPDAFTSPDAMGDDTNQEDDEDGVVFVTPLRKGQDTMVEVSASTDGFLDAWIDFNHNGQWLEPGEQIFTSQPLTPGVNQLTFTVPVDAVLANVTGRFRFSSAGGLNFNGEAADGEVEDYQMPIEPAIELVLTETITPQPLIVQSNGLITLQVRNDGPSPATDVVLNSILPASVPLVSLTSSQGTCLFEGNAITCYLGNLLPEAMASISIEARMNQLGLQTNFTSVQANEFDIDNRNNQSAITLPVTLPPRTPINNSLISISDNGPALSYPSTLFVSGLTSSIYKVTVTLSNLAHTFPDDFDILLVGPGGDAALLMSDAGDGNSLTNTTITLDDEALLALPDNEAILSGRRYRPANFGSDEDTFPAPAPAGPYGDSLSIFQNTNPNGAWSLYVVDDFPEDTGFMGNGWSLNIITMNPFADLEVALTESQGVIGIGSNLVYTVTVTNHGPSAISGVQLIDILPGEASWLTASPALGNCVETNHIVVCDLKDLNPNAGLRATFELRADQAGLLENIVQVRANQSDLNQINNQVSVSSVVRPIVDLLLTETTAPVPGNIAAPFTYTLTISNIGTNQATGLTLTDTLPSLISLNSVTPSQGSCRVNGGVVMCDLGNLAPSANATINISATPLALGSIVNQAVVTAQEIDRNFANNQTLSTSTVAILHPPFVRTGSITIPEVGTGSVYPSTLQVVGMTNAIYTVTLILSNLTHASPDDLDLLLVGPNGTSALVMSDAGGNRLTSSINLRLGETATAFLPDESPLTSGLFLPTDFDSGIDVFPAPAPPGPYAASLSSFVDTDPNGTWSLFLVDDQAPASGVLLGGWSLEFTSLKSMANLAIRQSASPSTAAVGANLTFTLNITNQGPSRAQSVMVTNQLPANVNFVSATSPQGSCTRQNNQVICDLGHIAIGQIASVQLRVVPTQRGILTNLVHVGSRELDLQLDDNTSILTVTAGHAPVISLVPNQITDEDRATGPIPFSYADADSAVSALILTTSSSNTNLVPASNITLGGLGTNRTVSITPATNLFGTATITLMARDPEGLVGQRSFVLTVQPVNDPPTLNPIAGVVVNEDSDSQIVSLSGISSGAVNENQFLNVFATSSNPSIIPHPVVLYNSPNPTGALFFRPTPNAFGPVTITVSVDDGGAENNIFMQTFTITVNRLNDDPPTISTVLDQETNEDIEAGPIVVNLSDPDENLSTLTVDGQSSNPLVVKDSNIRVTGNGASRTLTLTPEPDQFGTSMITLTVDDGTGLTDSTTFELTVHPVNDIPTLEDLSDVTLDEDTTLVVNLTGITSGAANEMQSLTVTVASSDELSLPTPTLNYSTPNLAGTLNLVPATNFFGMATVTVTVRDNGTTNNSVVKSFQVNVDPVNDPPFISSVPNQAVQESTPTDTLAFSIGDIDSPVGQLVVTGRSSDLDLFPAENFLFGGTGTNRTVVISPVTNLFGVATITLEVDDGAGESATTSFDITVNQVLEPVRILAITKTGAAVEIIFTSNLGKTYTVQFKNDLDDPSWLSLPAVPGTDSPVTVTNSNADQSPRFYRVQEN